MCALWPLNSGSKLLNNVGMCTTIYVKNIHFQVWCVNHQTIAGVMSVNVFLMAP